MCGIAGCKGTYSEHIIQKAADSIKHRGPDATAMYTHNDVTLIHHRLSIIDLSDKGAQPYHFEHLSMTYNGEVYNFEKIREELEQLGYTFSSRTDTEVIIKAFHQWGIDAVNKFIGMFSLALYNKQDNSITLLRDRFGVKPLYYTLDNGLAFGSELRAVLPFVSNKEIEPDSVFEYFRFGYISEDRTVFKSIKRLLPGHYLRFEKNNITQVCYWDAKVITTEPSEPLTDNEWKKKLHELLIDAFSIRMISDVPVGVFLSGGIDSSLVTAILQKHYGTVNTLTIGFNSERYNEAPYASKIAKHLGTNHTELTLELNEALHTLEKFYDIFDEPYADSSGIPTTIVSKLAAEKGIKVVLAANGGDELFAGYRHYQTTLNYYKKFNSIPDTIRRMLYKGTKTTYNTGLLKKIFSKNLEHRISVINELLKINKLGKFYNSFLANQGELELNALLKYRGRDTQDTILATDDMTGLMVYDLKHYLPDDLLIKMDRATMYNSIEGREPFLDHRVVKTACQMPLDLKFRNNESKWILKEILSEYVPKEMFMRPKMGFSIPIFSWFSQSMDVLFEKYLTPSNIERTGLFNTSEVLNEYQKYLWNKQHNKEYNIEKMWRILSFMMWWDRWVENN
ncbi:MAG: asparagine synthase (glutamine-hydrolyzing) [Bacteroidetes bacterium]|nr:asparagine synthase (glutamine-hydrolyzing) [Bacteroidota bacterium]